MSIPTGQPWLQDLWEDAQDKPEYATTALWENIFAEVFRALGSAGVGAA